jgi:hypothetical protein
MDTPHLTGLPSGRPPLLRVDSDPWSSYLALRTPATRVGLKTALTEELLTAISDGNVAAVTALIADIEPSVTPSPIDVAADDGRPPIVVSAVVGDEAVACAIMRALLSRGASVHVADAGLRSSLHWAGQ